MADITSVHDTFVRAILADKNIALDYFKASLPAYLLDKLDLSTLTQLPDTYVSKELQKTIADIVYSCRRKDGKGEVKISLLVEHKSWPYKYTPIQIGSYILSGYLQQIRNKEKPTLIIPILLYHGKRRWKYRTLAALFDNPDEELRQFVPDYEYIYNNLQAAADEQLEILENKLLSASFLVLKHTYEKLWLDENGLRLLTGLEGVSEHLQAEFLVYYVKRSGLKEERILEIVEELPLQIKNTVMTTLDIFVEKGIKIGEEKNTEKAVRNMIREGATTEFICKVLEVIPDYVAAIRKEMEK